MIQDSEGAEGDDGSESSRLTALPLNDEDFNSNFCEQIQSAFNFTRCKSSGASRRIPRDTSRSATHCSENEDHGNVMLRMKAVVKMLWRSRASVEDRVRATFTDLDKNSSGFLDAEELMSSVGEIMERWELAACVVFVYGRGAATENEPQDIQVRNLSSNRVVCSTKKVPFSY